jgi:hypothetical protein
LGCGEEAGDMTDGDEVDRMIRDRIHGSERTLAEAQYEMRAAATFSREPAAWAVEVVEAEGASSGPGPLALFVEAGFCEEDARRGVFLLESGRYVSFEDVALSMGVFDQDFRSRNPRATRSRIAEVAAKAPAGKPVRS